MQRQTRYMERTNSMNIRGKRSLETEEDQPERKRPALASVIVEALKLDSLQKLCSSLEPILRRVVSEEVERALAKMGPARVNGRTSPKRIDAPEGRNLQLQFQSRLSLPLFTGGKVEGEQGATIHVVLVDADSGRVVTVGPEASVKLDIVVLEGDFNNEDDEGWTQEEFDSHVVKERQGKRPLLTGDLQVTLKEGVGTLGELTFTDNSSWIRSRKFRLGLKAASGFCEGIRIREAKTEAITVKDHRGELYKKHYPPALTDEVWRLEKIGKDGSFHKRLNNNGIFTVEDFLRLVVRDLQKLRNALGSGMSNKMWEALLEHAKTCVLSGKLYVYHQEDNRSMGVAFNNIYELNGLIAGDQYYPADSLSDSQRFYVDSLVKKAYENLNQVIEYDGKSLLGVKETRRSARNDPHVDNSNSIDHHHHQQQELIRLPIAFTPEQLSPDSTLIVGGGDMTIGYSNQAQIVTSVSYGAAPHDQLTINNCSNQAENCLRSGVNPFEDWTRGGGGGSKSLEMGLLTEDEIRVRSHEMLENEDMQDMLRLFSFGGGHSANMGEEGGYVFPPYNMPSSSSGSPLQQTLQFDDEEEEDRSRPGKAVVGWLKIKAAMRWGFFIRKKAAQRRQQAHIVQLDE